MVIAINIFCILVFVVDIGIQLKTGYIYRGIIILDRRRVVNRYVRSYLLVDVILIVIIIAAMVSEDRVINIAKLIIIAKFIRMFQIDELYMRRLSTAVNTKILYVVSKQLVTLFILAHTIGLFFYGIDLALTNDPICINNNSCKTFLIKYVGSTHLQLIHRLIASTGKSNTFTLFIGASIQWLLSAMEILHLIIHNKQHMVPSASVLDL